MNDDPSRLLSGTYTGLNRFGGGSALLYAFLLLPTVWLLLHNGCDDARISAHIKSAWRWKPAQWALDVGRFLLIAGVGLLYVRGGIALERGTRGLSPHAGKALTGRLLAWAAVFGVLTLGVVPFQSHDLYGYLNRGAQQAFYHLNPYVTTVGAMGERWRSDPMFHAHWLGNPCPYGFFFAQTAQWLCQLSERHFVGALLLFKTVSLAAHLGSAWLIAWLSGVLNRPRPWLAVYAMAWNPLLLLQGVANGHNDGWMAFLLLLGLASYFSGSSRKAAAYGALPLIALSGLVKLATFPLLPLFALSFWKARRREALLIGSLLSVVVIGALALPYVGNIGAFPWGAMAENAGISQHSLHSLLYRLFFYAAHALPWMQSFVPAVYAGLKWTLWLIFGGFYLSRLLGVLREPKGPSADRLLWEVVAILTALVVFASAKFHPWYCGMLLPPALLLPEGAWLRRFVWAFSLAQLLAFSSLENIHIVNVLALSVLPLCWALWSKRRT